MPGAVNRGQFACGAGKTTAMRAIGGVAAVDSGESLRLALSMAITLASSVAMARLAGKIYERAILRTGSRLRVRQVLRSHS